MADRREIWLDENDVVAAAQILSWIALPHRPQAGVDLLCQWFWARRRHRGELVPGLPFELKKPSQITPQLTAFRRKVLTGFRAGQWFELQVLSGPARPPMLQSFDVSVRSLARRQLHPSQRGEPDAEGNPIRNIWSQRKPIAHMAIAAANAIATDHTAQSVASFDLEMTLFNPVWISAAIEGAESRARGAMLTGAFRAEQLHRFRRDIFDTT